MLKANMEKYFIGTDIGTTYVKVILFDSKGREAAIEKGSIGFIQTGHSM